jgi:hypothetical protein
MEATIYREHRPDRSELGGKISVAPQIGLARPKRVDALAASENEHGRNNDPSQ